MTENTKLDELMNALVTTRTEIRSLQQEEKALKVHQNDLESEIMWKMEEQGLDQIANDKCTISRKKEVVPTVEDWDQVYQHLIDTKQFELLQKRMSATAFRELLQMGMNVPGVKATELTRVNFRSK